MVVRRQAAFGTSIAVSCHPESAGLSQNGSRKENAPRVPEELLYWLRDCMLCMQRAETRGSANDDSGNRVSPLLGYPDP